MANSTVEKILKEIEQLSPKAEGEHVGIVTAVGDGVVAIDRQWNITLWNPTATLISGYTEQEALGKPLHDILKFTRPWASFLL